MPQLSTFPIYAKSAFRNDQLSVKLKLGCDGIEYQMRDSDFASNSGELIKPEKVEKIIGKYPASVVHVPMSSANIEDESGIATSRRETAAAIAEKSAAVSGKRVLVVTHTETMPSSLSHGALYRLESELEKLFNKYPHVDLLIENTTAFRHLQNGSGELSSGYYDAPVRFMERFSRYSESGRLGICLDICHALISDLYMKAIFEVYGEQIFDTSLENYFNLYSPYIKLFHLASFTENGYGPGHHATPFGGDVEDLVRLDEFLDLYREHVPNKDIPVTLEINEEDLLVCDGYAKTKDLIATVSALNAS